MPDAFKIASPSATSAAPIQHARIGFSETFLNAASALAIAVGSVIICGVKIARTPYTLESPVRIAIALINRSGSVSQRTFTGLWRLQGLRRIAFNCLTVSGES